MPAPTPPLPSPSALASATTLTCPLSPSKPLPCTTDQADPPRSFPTPSRCSFALRRHCAHLRRACPSYTLTALNGDQPRNVRKALHSPIEHAGPSLTKPSRHQSRFRQPPLPRRAWSKVEPLLQPELYQIHVTWIEIRTQIRTKFVQIFSLRSSFHGLNLSEAHTIFPLARPVSGELAQPSVLQCVVYLPLAHVRSILQHGRGTHPCCCLLAPTHRHPFRNPRRSPPSPKTLPHHLAAANPSHQRSVCPTAAGEDGHVSELPCLHLVFLAMLIPLVLITPLVSQGGG